MKILIIRFSSIGDIVLTTPVVRCIKQQIPNSEIHYCSKSNFKTILENNPYIDKTHYLGGNLGSLISILKHEKFDCVIDLHNNLRTSIIKFRLGVKSYTFDKLNYKKWLLVNLKINQMPDIHIVDRYMATAEKLGVKNDQQGLDYFVPTKDEVKIHDFPEAFRIGYIAFAIGAQHFTKRLPEEKMIECIQQINYPVILLGGKEDFEAGNRVEQYFSGRNPHVLNLCGKYNLNQSASIIKQSKLVFSHDTGLMHIAAAFKKEIYSIWGNTVPGFGMYPYKTNYHVLENTGLKCRPCSKIGYKACPQGHFKCMNDMKFDSVKITL